MFGWLGAVQGAEIKELLIWIFLLQEWGILRGLRDDITLAVMWFAVMWFLAAVPWPSAVKT